MGTRNLTMVIDKEGQTKVAQYGQWDGYLEGQGLKILEAISDQSILESLEKKITVTRFLDDSDKEFIEAFDKAKPENRTPGQNEWFENFIHRDVGGDIIRNIANYDGTKGELLLQDNSEFAKDSLFCEFAYVIDFRSRTFEVYTGFVHEALDEKERFYSAEGPAKKAGGDYYPVKALMSFSLDNLPSRDEFLAKGKELLKEEE